MKKIFIITILLSTALLAQNKKDYQPEMFGYLRAWYKAETSSNQGQFLVKMARFGLKGDVNEYVSYKTMVDFARVGKLSTTTQVINGETVVKSVSANFSDVLLDAFAMVRPTKGLVFSFGQFKVPFSTDNLKSGAAIDFVNRPFLTNVAPALRDIGLMGSYKIKGNVPVEFNAGVFNGSGQNKPEDDKSVNYSLRAVVNPLSNLSLSANYYNGKLTSYNVSIFDFGIDINLGKLNLNGEYGQRTMDVTSASIKSFAFFTTTLYKFDLSGDFVSVIIPAVRYESFSPNSNANSKVDKTTIGLSFEFAKVTYAQFRVNYEIYNYKDGSTNPNALVLEMQTRF